MKLTPLQYLFELWHQFRIRNFKLPVYNYQVGDKVKYNWKAKLMLMPTIKNSVNDVLIIHEVKHKRNEYINYQNTRTKKRGWVDAYWIKKTK